MDSTKEFEKLYLGTMVQVGSKLMRLYPWGLESMDVIRMMNKVGRDSVILSVNTAIDNHMVALAFYAENTKKLSDFVRECRLLWCTSEGEVSKNSFYSNQVLVCETGREYLSPGSLVKNGYEIKLSKNNSHIFKNGEKVMIIDFVRSSWIIDINAPKSIGFVNDIRPASTIKIIQKLREELDEVLYKGFKEKNNDLSEFDFKMGKLSYRDRNIEMRKKAKCCAENVTWALNCSVHRVNTKHHLTNARFRKPRYGREECIGDYKIGKLLLRDVKYCPFDLYNSLCLNKLAEEGFEIYLTNENATITKDGDVFLTVPMVGRLWIANSLHEQKGWLKGGCPYETQSRVKFEAKYGNKFTTEEIKEAIRDMTHDCELEGKVHLPFGGNAKV